MIHKDKNKVSYERIFFYKKKHPCILSATFLELCVRWGFFYKKFSTFGVRNLQKNSHFGPFWEMNWPRRKEPPLTL